MKSKAVVAAAALAIGLSGCSYAAMAPSEQSVIQNGSPFPGANHNLVGCVGPAQTENETFNTVYKYPHRQIVWNASNDSTVKPQRGPYIVVSSSRGAAEMEVPVSVTFDMTSNCDLLKKFHAEIASGYSGWLNDDGTESDGWKALIAHVVGQPLQDTLNGVAQNYTWQDIWNNEDVRTQFRQEIDKQLPNATKARTNGVEYFSNFQVTVLKPTPVNAGLKAAIEEQQRLVQVAQGIQAQGVAQANADKAKADAEYDAAVQETRTEKEKALKLEAIISGFGSVDAYLRMQAIEHGQNTFQPQVVPQMVQGH
jgi:hypothetical protein